MALHAVAVATLTSFVCSCGLSFPSLLDLTAHVTLGNLAPATPDPTIPDPTAPAPAAPPPALLNLCTRPLCGHPRIAHLGGGQCCIILGAYGTDSPCACRRYNA